jgi:hypothetical protein
MSEKTFTQENVDRLCNTCANIQGLCDEAVDGQFMATQLMLLGKGICEFVENPIVANSGIQPSKPNTDENVESLCQTCNAYNFCIRRSSDHNNKFIQFDTCADKLFTDVPHEDRPVIGQCNMYSKSRSRYI